ncbi:MAG: hypothetical protein COV44_04635 [Deltaproteobacteria bacterium CG11_big_fil_rev_8_21_14_0_20_45_16]|nr:MAG: hypothetical protein COV44_04635 [Deltaproteobacteria bacterium CG11_big_fil_rev_8_21_14_0_20_45_16]
MIIKSWLKLAFFAVILAGSPSLTWGQEGPRSVSERLRDSANPRPILERDRYGFGIQTIAVLTDEDNLEAFKHLAKQNLLEDGSHPIHLNRYSTSRTIFTQAFRRSHDPLFYLRSDGTLAFRAYNIVHTWSAFQAAGVVQTNRRPGYIRNRFHTAEALPMRREEIFHMAFMDGLPDSSGIAKDFEATGLNISDYFWILFMPERFEWAVGEKIPLIPFGLPRKDLGEFDLSDFDFDRAIFITAEEALENANRLRQPSQILEAGLHIPLKKESIPEGENQRYLSLSLANLQSYYQQALDAFFIDLGFANSRNIQELRSTMNELMEATIGNSYDNMQWNGDLNPAAQVLLSGPMIEPSYIPESNRARVRNMSVSGWAARMTRGVERASNKIGELGKWVSQQLKRKNRETDQPARNILYRELITNFQEAVRELDSEGPSLYRLRAEESGFQNFVRINKLPDDPKHPGNSVAKAESWWKGKSAGRLISLGISATPWLLLSTFVVPLFEQDGMRLFMNCSAVGGMTGLTLLGIKTMLYFRNINIRDAHALNLLMDNSALDTENTEILLTESQRIERTISAPPNNEESNQSLGFWQSLRSRVSPRKNLLRLRKLVVDAYTGPYTVEKNRDRLA